MIFHIHRIETVAVFRFLFDAKKEQLHGSLPFPKKQKRKNKKPGRSPFKIKGTPWSFIL